MLIILKISIQKIVSSNFKQIFESNPQKIKILRDKFSAILSKHNFELPDKIFIDAIQKKKKLDFNNNFGLNINDLISLFNEFNKIFNMITKISNGSEKIFKPIIEKLFPDNNINNLSTENNNSYSIKKMIINCFADLINEDKFLKYALLAIRHKGINVDDFIQLDSLIVSSDKEFSNLEKLINREVKLIFEKIISNSIKNCNNKSIPKTPDNSEVSDNNEEENEKNDICYNDIFEEEYENELENYSENVYNNYDIDISENNIFLDEKKDKQQIYSNMIYNISHSINNINTPFIESNQNIIKNNCNSERTENEQAIHRCLDQFIENTKIKPINNSNNENYQKNKSNKKFIIPIILIISILMMKKIIKRKFQK